MTREEILKKAGINIEIRTVEETKRLINKETKMMEETEYIKYCFSAKICPKCGGHIEYARDIDNPFSHFHCDNCGRIDIYDY